MKKPVKISENKIEVEMLEFSASIIIKNKEGKIILSGQLFNDGDFFVHQANTVYINDNKVEKSKLEWDSINNPSNCNWHALHLKKSS